jgi:hypothetical protein
VAKVREIVDAHIRYNKVGPFILPIFVIAAAAVSLVRLRNRQEPHRYGYLSVLGLFAIALGMDAIASLRWIVYYINYNIYAAVPYVVGLSYFLALELTKQGWSRFRHGLVYVVVAAIAFQAALAGSYVPTGQGKQVIVDQGGIEKDYIPVPDSGAVGGLLPPEDIWSRLHDQVPQIENVLEWSERRDAYAAKSCLVPQRWATVGADIAARFSRPQGIVDFGNAPGGPYARFDVKQRAAVVAPDGQLPETVQEVTLSVLARILERPSISSSLGETVLLGTADFDIGLSYASGGAYRDEVYAYYGGGRHHLSTPKLSVVPGYWYQLVLTKNSEEFALYVDGQKINSAPPQVESATVKEWMLNFSQTRPKSSAFELASASIWTKALTPAQVQDLYSLQLAPSGAQACTAPTMWEWIRANGATRR